MFEYIGEMGKDYIYAVAPLLEDALMDRLGGEVGVGDYWEVEGRGSGLVGNWGWGGARVTPRKPPQSFSIQT
jgi:hypothetical protein